MSDAIVVVGPKTVSGPGAVDPERAAVALDCIDDGLALVGDRVVPVDELLRDVLRSALGGPCDGVVLVCPSWWPSSRVERVVAAAGPWTARQVVRRRVDVLTSVPTLVELAPELVVVHADGLRRAVARLSADGDAVDAVVACLDGLPAVTVDVPTGLALFGGRLADALRRRGIDTTVGDDHTLIRTARAQQDVVGDVEGSARRRAASPRAAAVVVAVVSATALSLAAVALRAPSDDAEGVTWLVEGRLAVEVPARWTVERITSGPGSARVQVVSPFDHSAAIHVTQSRVPDAQTLAAAAETLQMALADEPAGHFVDFAALGGRAGRPAVTYREIRAGRRIDWTVLVDDGVRIAIGCQGAAERPGPEQQCDRAIRSAHAVARK